MTKHRSIGERLRKARSPEARRQLLTDWAANWRADQMDIVRQLEDAIRAADHDALCSATGQLKAVTEKRFEGLTNLLRKLSSEDTPDAQS